MGEIKLHGITSFFLYPLFLSFCFIIIYNNIIIKHIKQKCMIKNKTCQLDKG